MQKLKRNYVGGLPALNAIDLLEESKQILVSRNNLRPSGKNSQLRKLDEFDLTEEWDCDLPVALSRVRNAVNELNPEVDASVIADIKKTYTQSLLMRLVMEEDTSLDRKCFQVLGFDPNFLRKGFKAHNMYVSPKKTPNAVEYSNHSSQTAERLFLFLSENLDEQEQQEFLCSMHPSEIYRYVLSEVSTYCTKYPSGRFELHAVFDRGWSVPENMIFTAWLHENHTEISRGVMYSVLESDFAEVRAILKETYQEDRLSKAFEEEILTDRERIRLIESIFDDENT